MTRSPAAPFTVQIEGAYMTEYDRLIMFNIQISEMPDTFSQFRLQQIRQLAPCQKEVLKYFICSSRSRELVWQMAGRISTLYSICSAKNTWHLFTWRSLVLRQCQSHGAITQSSHEWDHKKRVICHGTWKTAFSAEIFQKFSNLLAMT